ncbi:hypothetical protein [uncultured Pseudoteredinibacter sp.]|uniref:alpha/beta hydrolase family protein n=1 Tax=uncultured Pseudoteredinibacter sp. TaxID=1641701 RepID=UPI00262F9619|nr:hypothetical protein [uncultured Pseudoteredinibacter sp.]
MKTLAKILFTCIALILVLLHGAALHASSQSKLVSYETDFYDQDRQRPIKVTVWYLSGESGNSCESSANSRCLATSSSKAKLVVLSYGAMGSVRSMNWLAYPLAAKGYIVAGINHFGESWVYGRENTQTQAALKLWERPLDISYVLDQFNKQSPFQLPLDIENTTAIGFSSGGSTVLSLAGARYAFEQARIHCQNAAKVDLSCRYTQDDLPELPKRAKQSLKDNRIKQVIALDPAAGHITSTKSLTKITAKALIFGLANGDFLPLQYHAGFYQEHIKNSELYRFEGNEGHFVFQDSCELDIKVHGIALCTDKKGVDRKKVQQQALSRIFEFLK